MGDELDDTDGQEFDPTTSAAPGLTDDDLYHALASTRRRRALVYLFEGGRLTADELASLLAGWNVASEGGVATPSDREQILLSLVHSDLPLLDDVGLVDYHPPSGSIHASPVSPAVERLVRRSVGTPATEP